MDLFFSLWPAYFVHVKIDVKKLSILLLEFSVKHELV